MKPQQRLKLANNLAKKLNNVEVAPERRRGDKVIPAEYGVDDNQLGALVSYLLMRKNHVSEAKATLQQFRHLLKALPTSGFATRSGKTRKQFEGMKEIITEMLAGEFSNIVESKEMLDDFIRVLGWTARLMKYPPNQPLPQK